LRNHYAALDASVVPTLAQRTRKNGAPSSDEGAGKVKINVKGNGQECPFHTGNNQGNINFKTGAGGVRGNIAD
jgi:hypothetical protein